MAENGREEARSTDIDDSLISVEGLLDPHWRERLDQFACDEDPWKISISKMAEEFQRELDRLEGRNLDLSGRMVLTCAVLLRAKAEGLQGRDNGSEEEFEEEIEPGFWGYEEFEDEHYIPSLDVPLKRVNKRTVTREELKGAFNHAIEVHERREERWEEDRDEVAPDWGMDLEGENNFRVKLQRLYRKVKEKLSRGKEVLFSSLLDRDSKEEKFTKFMELIHLQSEGKISCEQEEPFSEIKVKLNEEDSAE